MKSLTVGIYAKAFSRPNSVQARYAYSLLFELAKAGDQNTYHIFLTREPKIKLPKNVMVHILENGLMKNDIEDQAKKLSCDIMHCFDREGYIFKSIPSVVTLTSNFFREQGLGAWYKKYMVGRILKKSDGIVAVSDTLRKDYARSYNIPLDRIRVVAPGKNTVFSKMPELAAIKETQQRYQLPENYILHVGRFWKDGNFNTMLKAFAKLQKEVGRNNLYLVLAGRNSYNPTMHEYSKRELQRLLKAEGIDQRTIVTGQAKQSELNTLYRLSKGLVCGESFLHFPYVVLEGMVAGVPIAHPNTSMYQEVITDAGIGYKADSVKSIFFAMMKLFDDTYKKDEILQRALTRTLDFNWEKSARFLLQEWDTVVDSSSKKG